jgi:alginate O-acetyltransferase complex protein AlgI
MAFTSFIFFIFFALFFAAWLVIGTGPSKAIHRRWILLTFSSFFFYGWWNWRFLGLLIATGLLDFFLALKIDGSTTEKNRKRLMILSVFSNLFVLALFKYAFFFGNNLEQVLHSIGFNIEITDKLPDAFYILPIGISFYTFESLSYTIDVYLRHIRPTRNVFHYFSFLSMFPRLIAGPIERPANLLPQLEKAEPVPPEMIWKGFFLIISGYFKKLVIADNLAPFVNVGFASTDVLSGASWWLIMFAFGIQIYCDFSGYSDIARGLANLMGFEFKLNFNSPYISLGFSDFWSRWHISLSSWFRDYLYIPLGGDRISPLRTHLNQWITMLISGLWHGANWTYVAWGAFHAALLSIERLTRWPKAFEKLKFPAQFIGVLLTFALATLAWVFFRAPTIEKAIEVVIAMVRFQSGVNYSNSIVKVLIGISLAPQFYQFFKRKRVMESFEPTVGILILLVAMIVLCFFARGPGSTFIYFQF